jgi:hypothetical protein
MLVVDRGADHPIFSHLLVEAAAFGGDLIARALELIARDSSERTAALDCRNETLALRLTRSKKVKPETRNVGC